MDIHVGSLPFKLKEKGLIALFEQYGRVDYAKIIIDKITRQSKGFGFVTMRHEDEAKAAIKALNKSVVMGRAIEVSVSVKKKDVDKSAGKKSGGRPGNTVHHKPKFSTKVLAKRKAVKEAKQKRFEEKRADMKTIKKTPRHKRR